MCGKFKEWGEGMTSLAERLRMIILEQKVTQLEFARVVGVSANYINLLANGKKRSISAALAMRVQEAYGYSGHWLLTGEGERYYDFSKAKVETLKKIEGLDDGAVDRVLAFLKALDQEEAFSGIG